MTSYQGINGWIVAAEQASISAEALEFINTEYKNEKKKILENHERQVVSLQITQLEELLALARKYEDFDMFDSYQKLINNRKKLLQNDF